VKGTATPRSVKLVGLWDWTRDGLDVLIRACCARKINKSLVFGGSGREIVQCRPSSEMPPMMPQ
jgi:hypothetical protein